MADCLLLLTEQLMTACDLNAQFDHRKLDHGTEKWLSGFFFRYGTGSLVQAGMTHQAVADHFNVSRITFSMLMIRFRQTGRTNDRPNSCPDHSTSASKTVRIHHNKRMCCHVWSLQRRRAQAQASLLPDLSPIEHLWDELGRRVCHRQNPPETLQELRDALVHVWNNISQAFIQRLERKKIDKNRII
jgi:hypothetical protein